MLKLKTEDLFTTEEERMDAQKERINAIKIEELHDFPNHPFSVRDNENMEELVQSIKDNGLLHPILVRQRVVTNEGGELVNDGYEIIAGHRRRHACIKAGMTEIPALIKNLKDDEATIFMVDSNIQRDDVPPSERARAYKLRAEAQKNLAYISGSSEPNEADTAMNATIWRYLRLAELVPDLLKLADEKRLGLIQGVCLSYAEKDMQQIVADIMNNEDITTISRKQAETLKTLAVAGKLTEEKIIGYISGKKTVRTTDKKRPSITLKAKEIEDLVPMDADQETIKNYIIEALTFYYLNKPKEEQ